MSDGRAPSTLALDTAGVEESPRVWVAHGETHAVTEELLDELAVSAASHGRTRLLLHAGRNDVVQQMVIALRGDAYVRPHLNDRGFKSWQVLRGRLLFVLFDDDGGVRETVELGGSGSAVAVRLLERSYHTVAAFDEVVIYVETCQGPFVGTTYAGWAPPEDDSAAGALWLERRLREAADA